jgi:hypothetical protein
LLSRNTLLLLLLLSILLRIQRLHATALLSAIFIFGNGRRCRVIIRSITAANAATAHHHGLDEPWLHHDRMRLTVTLVLAADGAVVPLQGTPPFMLSSLTHCDFLVLIILPQPKEALRMLKSCDEKAFSPISLLLPLLLLRAIDFHFLILFFANTNTQRRKHGVLHCNLITSTSSSDQRSRPAHWYTSITLVHIVIKP